MGVEIDEQIVHHAKSRYFRDNLQFIRGSIVNIPIRGEEEVRSSCLLRGHRAHAEHDKLLSEVKRLLKNDGLFIVSTPNKTVYTDGLNYRNPFHVNEFYFDEFDSLLRRYFQDVHFLGQKVYMGSNIWSISSQRKPSYKEFLVKKGDKELYFSRGHSKTPLYFIALASDGKVDPHIVSVNSWLVDVSNILPLDYTRTG